jgi:hypothetical protein
MITFLLPSAFPALMSLEVTARAEKERIKNRDKISKEDIHKIKVTITIYEQYLKPDESNNGFALEEYCFACKVEGKSSTWSDSRKNLEELARVLVSYVIQDQQVIKPWYDIRLEEGPLPRSKLGEGYIRYTAAPSEEVKKQLLDLLIEARYELADTLNDSNGNNSNKNRRRQ